MCSLRPDLLIVEAVPPLVASAQVLHSKSLYLCASQIPFFSASNSLSSNLVNPVFIAQIPATWIRLDQGLEQLHPGRYSSGSEPNHLQSRLFGHPTRGPRRWKRTSLSRLHSPCTLQRHYNCLSSTRSTGQATFKTLFEDTSVFWPLSLLLLLQPIIHQRSLLALPRVAFFPYLDL
jgi:hypothetical protein